MEVEKVLNVTNHILRELGESVGIDPEEDFTEEMLGEVREMLNILDLVRAGIFIHLKKTGFFLGVLGIEGEEEEEPDAD